LLERKHGKLYLVNRNSTEQLVYCVEAEFPFDSVRKRMSLIISDEEGRYMLLCKGADNVMMERIVYEKNDIFNLKSLIDGDLYKYSCEGLRTLVMTKRNISTQEFSKFKKIYDKLMLSNHPMKEQKLFELYNSMEQKLRYLGCTAIEDKLQEGVAQTIAKVIEADIRFFMLTGDKLETAIEIAKSCKVIQEHMNIIYTTADDDHGVKKQTPSKKDLSKMFTKILENCHMDDETPIKSIAELNQQD